ncbi:MAG: S9 family peptidase [Euryarchaeota archaeon]|nr:S9 family peptidase [Euryarchaeota archaeon]
MSMIKIEDMYRMRLVGDVRVSPDGKKIAFVVARMNRNKDSYLSRIYIHDGKLKAFTSGDKDRSPRFTPDGKFLVYYRGKKEGGELRRISLSGGESEVVAELKNGASDLKIDGKYVYFISDEKEKKKDDVKRITRIPFYFNGEGFIYDSNPQIYRVPIRGGKVEKLTNEDAIISSFDVRDGKIVYAAADDEKEPFMEHLYIWDGKAKRITARKASIGAFRISPDGSRIAVFLKFNEKGMAEDMRLHFIPLTGGDYSIACEEGVAFGRSLNSDARFGGGSAMQWLNASEILFIVTRHGRQELLIYSDGKFHTFLGGERSVESFHYAEGTLAFVAQYINRPGEVFVKRSTERRITNFNRKFTSLPTPEKFTFTASDGAEIEGWILMPEGSGKHPAILEIHGGPKTSYGHAFMFEFYYLLSQGFAVIFTNPRGSSGYGEEFALHIRGGFGGRDYADLMEAIDHVLERYPIDPERVYVTGGSYGGFMTNWVVGHTSRFRAAATQRSISNQLSFWGTSDIGPWFNGDYIGAGKDLWEGFDEYWEMSPLKYAKNITTPLLIIHSEEDYRCPVSEAYQLFYALKMQSVDTKLVLFPGENHDLSRSGKPKHREARLKEIAEWFREH